MQQAVAAYPQVYVAAARLPDSAAAAHDENRLYSGVGGRQVRLFVTPGNAPQGRQMNRGWGEGIDAGGHIGTHVARQGRVIAVVEHGQRFQHAPLVRHQARPGAGEAQAVMKTEALHQPGQ